MRFSDAAGYGFIACDEADDGSGDILVRSADLRSDRDRPSLAVGAELEFEIEIEWTEWVGRVLRRRKAVNVTGPDGAFVKPRVKPAKVASGGGVGYVASYGPVRTDQNNSAMTDDARIDAVIATQQPTAPEIVCVSPAPSGSASSTRVVYEDDDSSKANSLASNDTEISSPVQRITPFVPSELTAKRDVFDFKLKRDDKAHARSGIVTRQLRALKTATQTAIKVPVGISLRNTLGLGLEHAGLAVRQPRFAMGRTIRLCSESTDYDGTSWCTNGAY